MPGPNFAPPGGFGNDESPRRRRPWPCQHLRLQRGRDSVLSALVGAHTPTVCHLGAHAHLATADQRGATGLPGHNKSRTQNPTADAPHSLGALWGGKGSADLLILTETASACLRVALGPSLVGGRPPQGNRGMVTDKQTKAALPYWGPCGTSCSTVPHTPVRMQADPPLGTNNNKKCPKRSPMSSTCHKEGGLAVWGAVQRGR